MMTTQDYRVGLDLSREQAHTVSLALNVLSALSIGKTDTLASLIGFGMIRGADDQNVDAEAETRIRGLMAQLAVELGYTAQSGVAMNRGKPLLARRSHELYFTLDNALAVADGVVAPEHPDARRGMNGIRFTDDVLPAVAIVRARGT